MLRFEPWGIGSNPGSAAIHVSNAVALGARQGTRGRNHEQVESLDLSVIVPAYNEGDCIAESIATITACLEDARLDYELVVVSDGSSDDTAEVVTALALDNPRLRLIAYTPNRGKGYAVRRGVAASRGRAVMFTDADLAVPMTILSDFLAALDAGFDIAIASRKHPASRMDSAPPRSRQLMTVVFSAVVRRVIGTSLRDTQCGCKLYRGELARELFTRQQVEHFSFDAEVLFLAQQRGYRVKEVPFALAHGPTGSSVRPVRDSLIMLRDLARIRLNAARGRYD